MYSFFFFNLCLVIANPPYIYNFDKKNIPPWVHMGFLEIQMVPYGNIRFADESLKFKLKSLSLGFSLNLVGVFLFLIGNIEGEVGVILEIFGQIFMNLGFVVFLHGLLKKNKTED